MKIHNVKMFTYLTSNLLSDSIGMIRNRTKKNADFVYKFK
jgi:hypothetical protein